MNNRYFPRILNTQDIYREFFGAPGKSNVSPKSERYINKVMGDVDQWTNDNKYKDAIRYSLDKQAEMGENFGVPTERMLSGLTLGMHDPSVSPSSLAHYNPESDTIYLPAPDTPVDAYRRVQDMTEDELKAYMHSIMAHEHDHYLLAHSIGRPFEFEQQRKHQLDKTAVPSNSGWGWSSLFRRPHERGLSFYGAEDFGRAYPSEEFPEISRLIAGGTFQHLPHTEQQLKRSVNLKRKMLYSLQKRGIADIPDPSKDLYDDVYGKGLVTYADETKTTNAVVQSMKKLAATKEILRNKLAILQNQTLGLRWLGGFQGGNENHDLNVVGDNNRLLGIVAPAFDNGWDVDAFSQGVRYPVSRNIDPLMHKIAKNDLVDPRNGTNINTCWPTPIGGYNKTLYRKNRI